MLRSFDDFVARVGAGYHHREPIWGENQAATSNTIIAGPAVSASRCSDIPPMDTLPTGVTAWIPSFVSFASSQATCALLGKAIDLGSLTLGNGAGGASSFADGSAMPTLTEAGVSRVVNSAVFAEVTTVISATPGNFTITYTNQDGTGGQASPSVAITGGSTVRSMSPVYLASGDTGVRDITASSRTGGTNPSGVLKFWGFIPIAIVSTIPLNVQGMPGIRSLLTVAPHVLRLGANDQIMVVHFNASAAKMGFGHIYFIGDN